MQKKIQKIFFDLEIIAFELVVLNTRFYCERIFVVGSQYVKKMSQDLRFHKNRFFGADFFLEWLKNMTKNTAVEIQALFWIL